MIDINTYRSRIGLFSPKNRRNRSVFSQDYNDLFWWKRNTSGKKALSSLQAVCKLLPVLGLVFSPAPYQQATVQAAPRHYYVAELDEYTPLLVRVHHQAAEFRSVGQSFGQITVINSYRDESELDEYTPLLVRAHCQAAGFRSAGYQRREQPDHNFEARYLYGNINKQKGIVNMHLNIRSLRFKVAEVKHLIKEHNPHIFGISESELKRNMIEEEALKIPGYNILFPKSWTKHGYARVLVYVKKTFKYQQV